MGIDDQLIQEIVQRILSAVRPDRIILFGSVAEGRMGRDSDIDLLILEASPGDVWEESARAYRSLRGLSFPFDVFVMATEAFEESKNVVGGLAFPANKYGRVIYEAA